jgi:hypothetical protein
MDIWHSLGQPPRSYARKSIRGICVLSVNEVAETWKVPSDADKWQLKLRECWPIPSTDSISSHNPGPSSTPWAYKSCCARRRDMMQLEIAK